MHQIAKATYTDIESTTRLYVGLEQALDKYTSSQQEVLNMTQMLQTAAVVSGASQEDMKFSMRQLTQAMQGGIVRAEEYNSIMEQTPYIMQTVAKHIDGVNGDLGKLRQMMLDGKLTADVFYNAMVKGASDIEAAFAKMEPTVAQTWQNFVTESTNAVKTMDEIIEVSDILKDAIKGMGDVVDFSVWAFRRLELAGLQLEKMYLGLIKTAKKMAIAINKIGVTSDEKYQNVLKGDIANIDKIVGSLETRIGELSNELEGGYSRGELYPDTKIKDTGNAIKEVTEELEKNTAAQVKNNEVVQQNITLQDAHVEAYNKSRDALMSNIESMERALMSAEERALEAYNRRADMIQRAYDDGLISGGRADRLLDKAYADLLRKTEATGDEMSQLWIKTYRGMQDATEQFFLDVMQGNFDNLGEAFARLLQHMLAEWAATMTLMGLFGEGFGTTKWVPGGLMGDIIGSFGASSVPAGAGSMAAGPQVSLNITEAPGTVATPSVSYTPGGGLSLDVLIEKVEAGISKNVARGRGTLGSTMQGTYGLNRSVASYR
jgi:tape measure domain-containing protein